MKRTLRILLAACSALAMAAVAAAQDIAGEWAGVLEVAPGNRLTVIVRIKRDEAGALTGTMDSPAQSIHGLPLAGIAAQEGRLAFAVPGIGGSYWADWIATPNAKLWRGEWSQAGMKWPLVLFVLPSPPPPPADWQPPPDDAIAMLIAARNAPRAGQGIIVGVLEPDNERVIAGGTGVSASVDRNTLFEIGSITKVFTALILADMVNKDEVSLDDPAAAYLPPGHRMPERGGRQITLRDLSTHMSGLPRTPTNAPMTDPGDPFADYTEEKLLAFLDGYQLTRDIGSQWEYSNLGVGLLGYLLGRAAGTDYETLLRKRITEPLGMNDTMIALRPRDAERLATPHDAYMRRVKPWHGGVLQGKGSIRSSASDMLTFAKAALDPDSPIAAAMRTTLSVRAPGSTGNVEQALGWSVMNPQPGRDIVMHGGTTGGYEAMLALEPAKGRAVVTLMNSSAQPGAHDFALHILLGSPVASAPAIPPAPPWPVQRTQISLPATELEKFVGRYDFGYSVVLAVSREGSSLHVLREGIPGAAALPVFPEAPLAFFWNAADAQIRFITDESGAVTGAELIQGGVTLAGKRMSP